jgi:hypothetical protein
VSESQRLSNGQDVEFQLVVEIRISLAGLTLPAPAQEIFAAIA